MPLRDLTRALLRTISWSGLAAGSVLAGAIVWHEQTDPFGSPPDIMFALRLAAMAMAVGIAFVLDDPSEDTTAPAPVTIMTRRALRVALTAPIALGFWLLLLFYANGAPYMDAPIPIWPTLLEVIAFCATGLAGAALGIRFLSDRLGAPAGIGAVMVAALFVTILPWGRGPMILFPGTPAYAREIEWWWLIAIGSLAALVRMSAVPGMRIVRLRPRKSPPLTPTRPPLDPRRP